MSASALKLIQKKDGWLIDRWIGNLNSKCSNMFIVESRLCIVVKVFKLLFVLENFYIKSKEKSSI